MTFALLRSRDYLEPGSVAIAEHNHVSQPGSQPARRVPHIRDSLTGETELRAKKPDYFHTCITMFDDYTTFDARIPFVPFTGVFQWV